MVATSQIQLLKYGYSEELNFSLVYLIDTCDYWHHIGQYSSVSLRKYLLSTCNVSRTLVSRMGNQQRTEQGRYSHEANVLGRTINRYILGGTLNAMKHEQAKWIQNDGAYYFDLVK